MIFYTITGPTQSLEIRDDHLILKGRGPFSWFSKKDTLMTMPLTDIRQFMVDRNYAVMGKIVISNGDQTYSLTFTSPYKMVQMIEKYMQKKILKNVQAQNNVVSLSEKRKTRKISSPSIAA